MSSGMKADNVSILYITGDFKDIGLKDYVIKRLKGEYKVSEFWADRNISFELEKGDMLGIIGTNGAGKSTLLKAITGIMVPTEGTIKVKGQIAALLELASGFDGDLTVRENTFLRGAMLGYTREFMNEMYDSIIEFAELEDFQDRSFKQLSSGMKSRLAFSIACLVNPDVIILDEVLSVGDGSFRKKSGDKMREILDSGVTGILVSHTPIQIREMCNKILWLDHGKQIVFSDNIKLCMDAYEEFLLTNKLPQSDEDIIELSEAFIKRKEEKKERLKKTESQKLQAMLEAGDSEAAIKAAVNLLKKKKPELLVKKKKKKKPIQPVLPEEPKVEVNPEVVLEIKPEEKAEAKEKTMPEIKPDAATLVEGLIRISGKTRYETSLNIANKLKEKLNVERFDSIVLTNGINYADALSGSYLAKGKKSPMIFVDLKNVEKSLDYISTNLSENGTVYLVGEINNLPDETFNGVNGYINRIQGENTYITNLEILKDTVMKDNRLLVCTGEDFADNISAIATGIPVLLVNDSLTQEQQNYISELKQTTFYIIGGTRAVNEDIENVLKNSGEVVRISGKTRYETSVMIARTFFEKPQAAVLTSGVNFTDGFCGGVFASHFNIPMILTVDKNMTPAQEYIQENDIKEGYVLGGAPLVSNTTANSIFMPCNKEEI